MPRTPAQASPNLEILLDGARYSYRADDTISGRVSRTAPLVASHARLSIQLCGRTKSRMTVSRGQAGTSTYRGRFNLFNSEGNKQDLFDGPIHIEADGGSRDWGFTLTIPSGPDPSAVVAGNNQKFSYLPLGRHDIQTHSLPPVFYMSGFFINTTYHCFVEYFLEAKLHISAAGGDERVQRAIVPLSILPLSTPDFLTEFQPTKHSFLCRISTYRFMHGEEAGGLSLGQKTREFFGSSKVPQFTFSLQVEHPVVLQVENSINIPFRLLVLPDYDQTSEAIRDSPHTVTLTSMTFEIKASTKLICRGTLSPHTADQTRKVGADLKSAIDQHREPIVLPSGDKAEPLDVGDLLQLNLTSLIPRGIRAFSKRQTERLYPSFTTYNIKHAHKLKWTLTLMAAGVITEVSSEADLTLLSGQLGELPPYEENEELPPPVEEKEG
ncbi:hypothetical protein DL766_003717 [Monosporascus sp. MC13-8B]|uniref:Arrestin-like N-terminal domain-containing protein n=1 Tax=Monosporascus cannonballus TaxID=155416 RepID=A0ABY0H2Y2_9PEZI|nr:hypothetical protein DL762_006109 [Monosporascus cannonballus]RYO88271.1 hypothetical protein DL763_006058 [Monosporascus cannonballus]RYP32993.1 hypothetical protein DL766_003717 [Monosporascus sp. MC13-8B]